MKPAMVTILGPTASGKTSLAAIVADLLDGEVISADSRQVYRGLDIGTGKDLADYRINDRVVPGHLIDIADPGEEYNVFRYRQDFQKVFDDMVSRTKVSVFCGGSGMYLEAVLMGYNLPDVIENHELRNRLSDMSDLELVSMLESLKKVHANTDTSNRNRLLRAIEIELFRTQAPEGVTSAFIPSSINFGIIWPREMLKKRITDRLESRLEHGMVEEVEHLLQAGVPAKQLISYGLEYKYVTKYLLGELSYPEMFRQLNIAIHQFSKRQMTWFRRMERKGIEIQWIDGREEARIQAGIIVAKFNIIC